MHQAWNNQLSCHRVQSQAYIKSGSHNFPAVDYLREPKDDARPELKPKKVNFSMRACAELQFHVNFSRKSLPENFFF